MRYVRCFFSILLVMIMLTIGTVDVFAMNTGFYTEPLSESDIDTILKNVNISILEEEPPKKSIECFDVNENGVVAIGCYSTDYKTVCIYSSNGDFQYGYRFETSGTFGIELNDDILNIYLVRSDIAIAINPTGEVESVLKIPFTSENNSYWNHNIYSRQRKVGDVEYALKNDMGIFNLFASSYSQLIVTTPDGEENIMYDVNSTQLTKMIISSVGIFAFACFCVSTIVLQSIKFYRKRNATKTGEASGFES